MMDHMPHDIHSFITYFVNCHIFASKCFTRGSPNLTLFSKINILTSSKVCWRFIIPARHERRICSLFCSYPTDQATMVSCQKLGSSDFMISVTFRVLSLSANTDMATRSNTVTRASITTAMTSLFSSFVVGLHWQYCSRTTLLNTEENKMLQDIQTLSEWYNISTINKCFFLVLRPFIVFRK